MKQVIHNYPDIGTPFFYVIFFAIVAIMLCIDIFALNKQGPHKVSYKEALGWTIVWVIVSLGFAGWLYYEIAFNAEYGELLVRKELAHEKVMEFLTGYVLEKSLAIDNVFVFLMIFSFFKVPSEWQRRVLIYGVFGAIFLRLVMIAIGSALIKEYSEILYFFGAFLLYTGFKMLKPQKEEVDLSDNKLLHWLKKKLKVTEEFHGEHFFIKENGMRYATPLFLVLLMVELSDIIFAVDSIPAVFAVTTDPFIVITSNILAILGLRAMYFLLADIADRFDYLKYGLAVVLMFVGIKMLVVMFGLHVPIWLSLLVIFGVITSSIVLSLFKTKKEIN